MSISIFTIGGVEARGLTAALLSSMGMAKSSPLEPEDKRLPGGVTAKVTVLLRGGRGGGGGGGGGAGVGVASNEPD